MIFLIQTLLLLMIAHPASLTGQDGLASSMTIRNAPGKIVIDGNLGDWGNIAPLELNSIKLVRGAPWNGVEDLSARIWLSWNESSLFFAVDLHDDEFNGCPPGVELWNADVFLVTLSFPETDIEDDQFFIFASQDNNGPRTAAIVGDGRNFREKLLPSLQLAVRDRDGFSLLMEGSVRWEDFLGQGAVAPERLQMNLEVRDLDNNGQLKSISWIPASGGRAGAATPELGLAVLVRSDSLDAMIAQRFSGSYTEIIQLVNLPIVVTDKFNRFVDNLDSEDFLILEDGIPQEVDSLSFETRPITVGLMIDSSGSMENRIDDAKRAAGSFLDSLRDEDRAFVVSFNHNIELLKDFQGDNNAAKKVISEIKAGGGTMLYASILFALEKMQYLREKKVLILLTDGKDESRGENPYGKAIGMEQLIELAKRQEVLVYAVAFRLRDSLAVRELRHLCLATGGRLFTTNNASQLINAYGSIAEDLKSQYLVSYISNNHIWDGSWRNIEVTVKEQKYNVRTRSGYYAPKK